MSEKFWTQQEFAKIMRSSDGFLLTLVYGILTLIKPHHSLAFTMGDLIRDQERDCQRNLR